MRPTAAQEKALLRQAGCRRFVWNWALARRKADYAEHGTGMSQALLSKELTDLKRLPETKWLNEADSQALQQTLRDLDAAFVAFFEKRARFPRFKSKKRDTPRFRVPQRVKIQDGKVYVPKAGWVRVRQSQAVDAETKSATFKRDACGHWYVTLVAAFTLPEPGPSVPEPERTAGIDLGLKTFAALSTGEKVPPPKFYRRRQRQLRRAQRVFSRRQAGSKRKARARQKVARVHQKIADRRQDFLHKLSTVIVKRFDGVCVEDLNVKGLARTKLAKSFADAAHGEFLRQLRYKATWHGKAFAAVDRFYPSSRTCHACNAVNGELTLADRVWRCPSCGAVLDRDHNASLNVRDEGLQILAVGHTREVKRSGSLRQTCHGGQRVPN
jgi:putative transposase